MDLPVLQVYRVVQAIRVVQAQMVIRTMILLTPPVVPVVAEAVLYLVPVVQVEQMVLTLTPVLPEHQVEIHAQVAVAVAERQADRPLTQAEEPEVTVVVSTVAVERQVRREVM